MTAKSLARIFVLTVALAAALGILGGVISVPLAALTVILVNGAVVAWLKWHEEQGLNHH